MGDEMGYKIGKVGLAALLDDSRQEIVVSLGVYIYDVEVWN